MSSHEYSKPTSGGAACTYASLCNYNNGGQMAPIPSSTRGAVGKYIVPAFNAIGYDALTHGGQGSCGGYFNIEGAYGANASQCNQKYVTSLCGGCNRN